MVVYSKFIRPYFLKHQGDIDQAVNDLSEKGKGIITSVWINHLIILS